MRPVGKRRTDHGVMVSQYMDELKLECVAASQEMCPEGLNVPARETREVSPAGFNKMCKI